MINSIIYLFVIINVIYFITCDFSIAYFINNKRLVLIFYLGTNVQIVPSPINQDKQFSLITGDSYKPNLSTTAEIKKMQFLQIENNTAEIAQYADYLKFYHSQKGDSKYNFYMLKETDRDISNLVYKKYGISFAYKFIDNSYSIIHNLKSNGVIDRLTFSFNPVMKDRGSLVFGATLKETTAKNQIFKCKVDQHYTTWGCQMNKIILTNEKEIFEYKVGRHTEFMMNKNKMIVPCNFMDFVMDVMKRKTECVYHIKEGTHKQYMQCDAKNNMYDYMVMKFEIEGQRFSVKVNEMFICTEDKCNSQFKCVTDSTENKFILSRIVLNHYTSLFSYEDSSVTLIPSSKESLIEKISISNNSLYFLIVTTSVLNLSAIVYLCVINIKVLYNSLFL